jgi:hypothetical protein
MCSDVRLCTVGSQLLGNFVYGQRLAEVIALNFVAPIHPEECHLRFVFDAFGNHSKIQAFCHADDCGSDCRIIGIQSDIPYKRAVDLQLADLKLSQVAEAGIASSEVVDR